MAGGFISDIFKEEEPLSAQRTVFGTDVNFESETPVPIGGQIIDGNLSTNPFSTTELRGAIELPDVDPSISMGLSAPDTSLLVPEVKFNFPVVGGPSLPAELGFSGGDIDISIPNFPNVNIPDDVPIGSVNVQPIIAGFENLVGVGEDVISVAGEVASPVVETGLDVGAELVEIVGKTANDLGGVIAQLSQPAQAAVQTVIDETGSVIGAVAEDASVTTGDGSGFGEVSIGEGFVLDISDKINNQFSEATEGTSLQDVVAEDLYNAINNPVDFISTQGQEQALEFVSNNTGLSANAVTDVVNFIDNPVDFLETQSMEAVSNMVADNLPIPGGSAAIAAGLTNLINGGNVGEASAVVGNALAMEMTFAAANAVLPGSGEVLRLAIALGIDDDIVAFVETGFSAAEDVAFAAGEAVGIDEETLIGGGAVEDVAGAIGAIGGAAEDVANFGGGVIDSIVSYGCNLSTLAYRDNLITKDEFLDFPRYRIRIQRHEFLADKFWAGYVVMTNFIKPKLIKNKRLNKLIFKYVTRPWLNYMQYRMKKRSFSFSGVMVMNVMRVVSLMSYVLNKRKADKLNDFFINNSIMSIYRGICKEVENK